jgi:hypothetical protein
MVFGPPGAMKAQFLGKLNLLGSLLDYPFGVAVFRPGKGVKKANFI